MSLQKLLIEFFKELVPPRSKVLLIGGVFDPTFASLKQENTLYALQSEKKFFDDFEVKQVKTFPSMSEIKGETFDVIFFIGSRYKSLNQDIYRKIPLLLNSGGIFAAAFSNLQGASRYENLLDQYYQSEIISYSKNKSRFFGFQKFIPTNWIDSDTSPITFDDALPVFNEGQIDKGSLLLSEVLEGNLSGSITEFCSGSGALASALIEKNPAITSYQGFESDYISWKSSDDLKMSNASFAWKDIFQLKTDQKFKTIILNPPFHDNAGENTELGIRIIQKAMEHLEKAGQLFVVQNDHLPYLKQLERDNIHVIKRAYGFAVWVYEA